MGTAMTGFLQGFAETSLALEKRRREREREEQELALKKEDLALRRDVLRGQEASRKLQDMVHQLGIQKALQEYGRQQRAAQLLSEAQDPGAGAGPMPGPVSQPPSPLPTEVLPPVESQVVPNLADPAQPPQILPPQQQSSLGAPSAPGAQAIHQAIVHGAQQRGINPVLALSLFRQESGYDPSATGKGGEIGLGQWTQRTAKERGLDLNRLRTDWQYNVNASLDYLNDLTKQHGDPLAAVRAYNGGGDPNYVPNVLRWMPDSQRIVAHLGGTAPTGQMVAGPGAAAPTSPLARQPSTVPESPELTALNQRIARLDTVQQHIESRLAQQPALRTEPVVKDTLQQLRTQRTELERQRTELVKEQAPVFDKDFEDFFATHHNGQRPAQAIRAPGGAAVVQQARAAYDAYNAEKEAHEAFLKEQKLMPLKRDLAAAAKAETPISKELAQSLGNYTSVYRSIEKIETFLREGTDVPEGFLDLVSQDAPQIQSYLLADKKQATGLFQQFLTKWGAASNNDPRVNRFLSALANMRDLLVQERSGANVTGNEITRNMGAFFGSLPNVNQAFALFAQNMANVKERVVDQLVTMGATVRPLSGGKAVFGGLPPAIRAQIVRNEQAAIEQFPGSTGSTGGIQVIGAPVQVGQ